MSRPACANPTCSCRWSIDVEPSWLDTINSTAAESNSASSRGAGCGALGDRSGLSALYGLPTAAANRPPGDWSQASRRAASATR